MYDKQFSLYEQLFEAYHANDSKMTMQPQTYSLHITREQLKILLDALGEGQTITSTNINELAAMARLKKGDRRKSFVRFNADGWTWFVRALQSKLQRVVNQSQYMPAVELIDSVRKHMDDVLTCEDCRHKRNSRVAGQAITSYCCAQCERIASYHNTATPNLCPYCAFIKLLCCRCMKPLK